jgi:hypothetical protein
MKSTVFVRPNLKLFFLGALLVLLIQHLILSGRSQSTAGTLLPVKAREAGSDELRDLLRRAADEPTAEVHTRLSLYFEKRGEYRKALMHLRKADKLREAEDAAE